MASLKDMSIRGRLTAGFGALIVLAVMMGIAGVSGVYSQYSTAKGTLQRELALYEQANTVSIELGNLRRYEKDVLLSADATDKAAAYYKKWQDTLAKVQTALARARELGIPAAEKQALDQLQADFAAYQSGAGAILETVSRGEQTSPTEAYAQMKPKREAAQRVEKGAASLNERTLTQIHTLDDAMSAGSKQTIIWLSVLGAIALVAGLLISLKISASITGPLLQIRTALGRIARDHDLTVELAAAGRDEAGDAARSLNDTQAALRQTLTQIREQTVLVNNYADQLASVSSQVTQRAVQQADATASSAASIEQMAVSVQSVSDTMSGVESQARSTLEQANAGAELASSTAQEVSTIADAINSTTRLIDGMDQRSAEIGGIIQVIKEIADQTNLLALNAAIEAARAGEQGRGFAVVADEVRKLAERTTQATNEIAGKISAVQTETRHAAESMQDANGRIDHSVDLARQVAERFRGISASATASSEKISEIAMALAEQTQASLTVSRNVETINQLSEQQSASARDATNLAHSLRDLAQQVDSLLAQFRVR